MYRLNDVQLQQLAEFSANLGLVFFATVVTPIFSTPEKTTPFMLIVGLILMTGCVILSMFLLKGATHES